MEVILFSSCGRPWSRDEVTGPLLNLVLLRWKYLVMIFQNKWHLLTLFQRTGTEISIRNIVSDEFTSLCAGELCSHNCAAELQAPPVCGRGMSRSGVRTYHSQGAVTFPSWAPSGCLFSSSLLFKGSFPHAQCIDHCDLSTWLKSLKRGKISFGSGFQRTSQSIMVERLWKQKCLSEAVHTVGDQEEDRQELGDRLRLQRLSLTDSFLSARPHLKVP